MKLRPFELALVIVFVVLALGAIFLLATAEPGRDEPEAGSVSGSVEIWGMLPRESVEATIDAYAEVYDSYSNVSYRYVRPAQFNNTLINALADDSGPDIVIISHEGLVDTRRRIFPDTYENYPLVDIGNRFIDGAKVFALSDGLYARPVAVDPLVMYWNRDILASAGFLDAPSTWEALLNRQFPELIDRSFDRTINQAVLALGEYGNVRNAYGVISTLLLQGGSAGVQDVGGEYELLLNETISGPGRPLRSAVSFYTRFSQPQNTLYTWNRSYVDDQAEFTSGRLAFYFGFASEAAALQARNPNLNFSVAAVPQRETANTPRTYGTFYGMAILRSTDNYPGASRVLAEFSQSDVAESIAIRAGMVPVTRAAVSAGSNDLFGRVAYQTAPTTYGWLNPNRAAVDAAFQTMVEDVNESRAEEDEAVRDALERLRQAY